MVEGKKGRNLQQVERRVREKSVLFFTHFCAKVPLLTAKLKNGQFPCLDQFLIGA